MEQMSVFDCSNVFIARYMTDDAGCQHENREHTLIYLLEGELELEERGRKTVLHKGECAFMRRDTRLWLQKRVSPDNKTYQSIVLKFSKAFLREYYQTIARKELPLEERREKCSLRLLPNNRPDINSLFQSIMPYFEAGIKPSDDILKLKMEEGVRVLLHTDKKLYASLFDFVDPWKVDILDYMNENYMYDLSLEDIAMNTGRSLSTFKRDFKRYSSLTPQKWLINRRLEAAHELIRKGGRKATDICYEVGFKNLSHFSKIYKASYGVSPTEG